MMIEQPPTLNTRIDQEEAGATRDDGFSLLELLVTITLLGILATIVTFAVGGLRAEAAESACAGDERTLWVAAESYFVQNETDVIPPTGVDDDRYERTLVADGFLRDASSNYDLDENGATTPEGTSPC